MIKQKLDIIVLGKQTLYIKKDKLLTKKLKNVN